METVTLKNGAEEVKSLVVVTMLSLESLIEEQPFAFYDLVMVCRDRDYRPFGSNGDHLKSLALLQDGGHVHDSIRNIVLSAVTGDGLDMQLGSPVAPDDGGGDREAA